MRKHTLLFLFITSFYFVQASSGRGIPERTKNHFSALNHFQSVCTCSHTFYYGGYLFEYYVAFESTNGCDPCFSTDSYAGLFSGGRMLDEGVPTESGVGFACGVNMSYCPN